MSVECYPMTLMPHLSRLYADYLALSDLPADSPIRSWYATAPGGTGWMRSAPGDQEREALASALEAQNLNFGAAAPALENIEKLRRGAQAVVTGQQVGLLGGPLLTLLKAATAVARAREATARTGIDHVPIFWLASEDHDLAEVDQISLPAKHALETLRLNLPDQGRPVGGILLGAGVEDLLDQISELLAYAPICDVLRACYTPGATLASAFGSLLARLFAEHGLIVLDAASPAFHRLGASTLRAALTDAAALETALLVRTEELERAGYHAQVLVKPGASLLFLLDEQTGRRQVLRRNGDSWKAGNQAYSTADLLAILDRNPERLSPNALLRPLFQDSILPTAAYVGGPAEIAYFAQSEALYRHVLGRVTPVLPRFSATLIEPAVASVMTRHELTLEDLYTAKTPEALTQRLGARALPIEGKRRIAAAGNAMDEELTALTGYLASLDASLGRSAEVSASKMRYQMNRLRRMAASFQVQKEASLRKHAEAVMLKLLPAGHPQERTIGGAWFLAQEAENPAGLIARLVDEAAAMCLGHSVIRL